MGVPMPYGEYLTVRYALMSRLNTIYGVKDFDLCEDGQKDVMHIVRTIRNRWQNDGGLDRLVNNFVYIFYIRNNQLIIEDPSTTLWQLKQNVINEALSFVLTFS